jgi:hypothetical protein
MCEFFRAGSELFPLSSIASIDTTLLVSSGTVAVNLKDKTITLSVPDSYDLLMQVKPSALEGRRLRWLRHRWALHNFIGHPIMQLLAICGYGKLGVKIHDKTVPRPLE